MSSSTLEPSGGSDDRARSCRACGTPKPPGDFTPGELRSSSPRCRACVRAKNRASYDANRADRQARNRAYYQANRDALLAASRIRHRENAEQYKEQRALWWAANRDRINTERREFRSAETYRSWVWRLRKHGLTPEGYWSLLDQQQGVCALCGTADPGKAGGSDERAFAVDHCHASGKVRGLLCHRCNRGLGYFRDHPEVLARAATYVADCC